jgi:hypothetical protein
LLQRLLQRPNILQNNNKSPNRSMEPLSAIDTWNLNQEIQKSYGLNDFETFSGEALAILDGPLSRDWVSSQLPDPQTLHHLRWLLLPAFGDIADPACQNSGYYLAEHPLPRLVPHTPDDACNVSGLIGAETVQPGNGLFKPDLSGLDAGPEPLSYPFSVDVHQPDPPDNHSPALTALTILNIEVKCISLGCLGTTCGHSDQVLQSQTDTKITHLHQIGQYAI